MAGGPSERRHSLLWPRIRRAGVAPEAGRKGGPRILRYPRRARVPPGRLAPRLGREGRRTDASEGGGPGTSLLRRRRIRSAQGRLGAREGLPRRLLLERRAGLAQ